MNSKKDLGISINKKLSNLSKKLAIPFKNIVTEFLLERLLVRIISNTELQKTIIFKGGYVCLKVYDSKRYTMDLDAVINKGNLNRIIDLIIELVVKNNNDGTWFVFEKKIDLQTQGEYGGIRIVFRAGIGDILKDIKRAQIIHFDLGVGDPITPSPVKLRTRELLENKDISWFVYPIETTVAEKLHALVVRGSLSSRSKDVYDLWYLLPKCNPETLIKSITDTFKFRGNNVPKNISKELKTIDTETLNRGWKSATVTIKENLLFTSVYKDVVSYCNEIIDSKLNT